MIDASVAGQITADNAEYSERAIEQQIRQAAERCQYSTEFEQDRWCGWMTQWLMDLGYRVTLLGTIGLVEVSWLKQ